MAGNNEDDPKRAFDQYLKDITREVLLENVITEEKTTNPDGTNSVVFVFNFSGYQGRLSLDAQSISEARRIVNFNQNDLISAFDQLTLNPASSPNMPGHDWRFAYDSYSASPTYKYWAVYGTLRNIVGKSFRFAMTKHY